ncbi:hypothetical protein KB345_005332, partial [Escherichia coli]|nr:hypothetical protein [Escherichia coli]
LGDEARAIQFPVLPADQPLQRIKPTAEQVAIVEKPSSAQASVETKKPLNNNAVAHITSYHDEILRTGQSLVQDQGDIILKAGMNSGSEVIASGNIHIYGTVR